MNKIDWKDVGARTIKTFVATFAGYLVVSDDLLLIRDTEGLMRYFAVMLASAASAGITAVWNLLLEIFRERFNALVDKVIGFIFKRKDELPDDAEVLPAADANEEPVDVDEVD